MEIFFRDPSEIPLPPEEVRIKNLITDVQPGGRTVRILLELDPFQKPPNVDLLMVDENGNELASVSIVETIQTKMDLMMHIRNLPIGNHCTLKATLFYSNLMNQNDEGENQDYFERNVVDISSISFMLTVE